MRFRVRALVVSLVAALAVLPAGAASAISTATLQAKLTREMQPRRRLLGRLRARSRQPADAVRRQSPTRRARPPRSRSSTRRPPPSCASDPTPRCPPRSPGAASSIPTASGAATSICAAAAIPRSAATTCSGWRARSARRGSLRVDGSVLGDESRFDSLRGSFDTGGAYDRDMGGVLGALTLNRGFSKDGKPAAAAAGQFAKALRGRRHPRRGPQRRRQRAGRGPGPGRRPLAADARPRPADQRPLGQLPGRDAAQGPRRLVRQRRHDRGRRRRGQEPAPEPSA